MDDIQSILRKKNLDLYMFCSVYKAEWYNKFRRHKLINKKLTEYEFNKLKEWLNWSSYKEE